MCRAGPYEERRRLVDRARHPKTHGAIHAQAELVGPVVMGPVVARAPTENADPELNGDMPLPSEALGRGVTVAQGLHRTLAGSTLELGSGSNRWYRGGSDKH